MKSANNTHTHSEVVCRKIVYLYIVCEKSVDFDPHNKLQTFKRLGKFVSITILYSFYYLFVLFYFFDGSFSYF